MITLSPKTRYDILAGDDKLLDTLVTGANSQIAELERQLLVEKGWVQKYREAYIQRCIGKS